MFQGAGTALGELPPYFMARAARLSGADLDDDEFEEIEELIHEKKEHPEELVSLTGYGPSESVYCYFWPFMFLWVPSSNHSVFSVYFIIFTFVLCAFCVNFCETIDTI